MMWHHVFHFGKNRVPLFQVLKPLRPPKNAKNCRRWVKGLADTERQQIERKIGNSLDGHVITLKEGAQAFSATYYRQPELAKKNPKLLFLSKADGGHFERLFGVNLTAERFLAASTLKMFVDDYVKRFGGMKRRKGRVDDWQKEYAQFFSESVFPEFGDIVDQVVPQSAVFLCATLFENYTRIQLKDVNELLSDLEKNPQEIINETLATVLRFAKRNPDVANKSWPTLLKSQSFFTHVCSYLRGVADYITE